MIKTYFPIERFSHGSFHPVMYQIFITYIAIFRLCVANPLPADSSPLNPQGGFPAAAYLPSILGSENATGNLYLPLKPGSYYDSEPKFAFGPATTGPFNGGELISSIAAQAYTAWKDTANAAIGAIDISRDVNFRNVVFRVRPVRSSGRPNQVLTPLKVGIAYLNMMLVLIRQQRVWPGLVTCSIFNFERRRMGDLLGWIQVQNVPPAGAGSTSAPRSDGDQLFNTTSDMQVRLVTKTSTSPNGELSTLPRDIRERAWLNVYLGMTYVFAQAPSVSVSTLLPPVSQRPTKKVTLHFRDPQFDKQLEGNVTIQLFDDPKLSRALTYDILAQAWLKLGVHAAERDRWDNTEVQEVYGDGQSLANITFGRTVRERPRSMVWDGIELTET